MQQMLTMEISKHLKYWEDNILSEVHQIDTANAYNGNIKALKVLRRQSSFRGTTNRCSKCLQKKNGNIKALKVLRREDNVLSEVHQIDVANA
jgi:predicted ATP-dependent protease